MKELSNVNRILFVCLGNICRSPLAEGVCRHHIRRLDLTDRLVIDSAGTGSWHVGDPPDARMTATAKKHDINIQDLRGRQFSSIDFESYDLILAMDRQNLSDILAKSTDPDANRKVRLFRSFDPLATARDIDVPDPYYGGQNGFDNVFNIVDRTIVAMLESLLIDSDA